MSDAATLAAKLLSQSLIDDAFTGRAAPGEVAARSRAWPLSLEWSNAVLVAATRSGGRLVEEYRYISAFDGSSQPIAVMFTHEDGRPVARLYGQHHWTPHREPMLPVDHTIHAGSGPDDPLGRYFDVIGRADLEGSVTVFEPTGYIQHSNGDTYLGHDRLREDFTKFFKVGAIKLRYCTMTDDGEICALEAIMPHGRPALAVYQRSRSGMKAARLYL